MEYVDGQTLRRPHTVLRRAPALGDGLHLSVGRRGDQYINTHGVIHRDIKSNNIKINSQGQVKMLDFGIAKGQTSPGLTATGSVIGTLQYLSPEHLRGGTADARGDIWALGVLLYEMVTGRMPFESETLGDLCDKIDRDLTPPANLSPACPGKDADFARA